MPGRYIAFEGVEGCGKSTHVQRLAAHLGAVVTREPGGTPIGTTLRAIMADPTNTHLSPRAEALMMAADRAQHLRELVLPALESGRHVVSDRTVYSSLAYQATAAVSMSPNYGASTILRSPHAGRTSSYIYVST